MDRMWVVVESHKVRHRVSRHSHPHSLLPGKGHNQLDPTCTCSTHQRYVDTCRRSNQQHYVDPKPSHPRNSPSPHGPRRRLLVHNPSTTTTTSATSQHDGDDDGRHFTSHAQPQPPAYHHTTS